MVEVVEARNLLKAELVGKADPLVSLWTQHIHKQQTVSPMRFHVAWEWAACCTFG